MKSIVLSTDEVIALKSGTKTTFRRPIHGVSGWERDGTYTNPAGLWFVFWGNGFHIVKPPYQLGETLFVKESCYKDAGRYLYRADYGPWEKFYVNGCEITLRWRSPVAMPREAARLFLKVTDMRVERLRDIREDGAILEGIPIEFPMDKRYCPRCGGTGSVMFPGEHMGMVEGDCPDCAYVRQRFARMWDSKQKSHLNDYGWNANPWVYVIEFKQISKKDL